MNRHLILPVPLELRRRRDAAIDDIGMGPMRQGGYRRRVIEGCTQPLDQINRAIWAVRYRDGRP